MNTKTYVTKPYLPPLAEMMPLLEKIWETRVLTNEGPFHQEFEAELANYLGCPYVSLFANGTLALVTALQSLRITGEVITTPYSFVATAHAALWNGIKPIFVDIDSKTFNIDPEKIEKAITPETTAIMPVHCYGHKADVSEIQKIADHYNLRLIYDAAHAFGVNDEQGSICKYGDMSILSFHATKVFNTFEGGAIICSNEKMKRHIDNLKNFGFLDETTVVASGINGKLNEFSSALGLLQLKYVKTIIDSRKKIANFYEKELSGINGIKINFNKNNIEHNYSYFPILIQSGYKISRDELFSLFRKNNIFARRYFYPLISEFPMYRNIPSARPNNLPIATQISREILCLPIFPDLDLNTQKKIISIIKNN